MVAYRRNFIPGGTYFFTVNLQDRTKCYLTEHINDLKAAFLLCKEKRPFQNLAFVILPDHLHCIMKLPSDDNDYPARWKLIKSTFTRRLIEAGVRLSKDKHGSYNLWQRRYWEHTIRDESDLNRHIEYIHYNPIKHQYVESLMDWPHSSFLHYVDKNILHANWGEEVEISQAEFGEPR